LQHQILVDGRFVFFVVDELLLDLEDVLQVELVLILDFHLAEFLQGGFRVQGQVCSDALSRVLLEYSFSIVDEFGFCFCATQVVEEVAEFDRLVVVDLHFDCGLLLSHLQVELDLRAHEARLCDECLFDADDFEFGADVLDDGLVLRLVTQLDATPDQVALADFLEDALGRSTGLLCHDPRELRLDAVRSFDAVVIDVHLDPVDLGLQVSVELVQHRLHVLQPLLCIVADELGQHPLGAFVARVADAELEFVRALLLYGLDLLGHAADVRCVKDHVRQASSGVFRVGLELVEGMGRQAAKHPVDGGLETLQLVAASLVFRLVCFDDVRQQYFVEFDQRRNKFLVYFDRIRFSRLFDSHKFLQKVLETINRV